MPNFQPVRGTRDLLPEDTKKLRNIIKQATEIAELYGFEEVITPILESFELLNVKSGEEIRQRMFAFDDLGKRKIVLRPEFTASIARIVTSTKLKARPKPLRLFSTGTVYRYDEPQRGRYREFWQSNFEFIGSEKPEADAEIILLTNRFMDQIGLKNFEFKIGHVGILRAVMIERGIDDKTQNAILQKMDKKEYDLALCLIYDEQCKKVFNSLISLTKNQSQKKKGNIIEEILKIVKPYKKAVDATNNLGAILELVKKSGCKINKVDPAFARGLEYYTGMIFEVYIPEIDIALGGGGRYDKLIEIFGGEPTPAVGAAHGLDRIMLAQEMQKGSMIKIATSLRARQRNGLKHKHNVFVVSIGDQPRTELFKFAEQMRRANINTEFETSGRKMQKVFEYANKRKPEFILIMGERELNEGKVVLKKWTTEEVKGEKSLTWTIHANIKDIKSNMSLMEKLNSEKSEKIKP